MFLILKNNYIYFLGPEEPGEQAHDLFVYYESLNPEEPRYRYTFCIIQLFVAPFLNFAAVQIPKFANRACSCYTFLRFCYRLLHLSLRTRVLPALVASAQRKPVPSRENAASDNIVVHMRNACKDFNAGLDSIVITQVQLVM